MKFFNRYRKFTDSELMSRVCDGDHKAFAELFDRYQQKLLNYFHKLLWNDQQMAEDFTQELFTKIIKKPELFNQQLNFSTWVFTVASNMCKNAYRKKAYEKAYLDQLPLDRTEEKYIEARIDADSRMAELHRVLNKLDEEKRQIFLMRYQQELSIKEIAAIVDCSEGTVKSRLFYIRKYILELFEESLLID
mgnify:CR=1 FL=1